MDNYPPGAANDPRAPYNQKENPEVEVEVTVSVTLSKTVKVLVTDYELIEDFDEDGPYVVKDFTIVLTGEHDGDCGQLLTPAMMIGVGGEAVTVV